jgi:sarcosine oxidase, subunit beta
MNRLSGVFVPYGNTFPPSADVVVIGGGIVGVATAFWLSRAGLDTVLVEMRDGLSTLTTPQSVESFRAQFTEPAMLNLAKGSIEVFENFSEVIGIPGFDISLRQHGYLFTSDDPSMVGLMKNAVDTHRNLGLMDSEFLTGDEIRSRFPYVSPNAVAATFRQKDGWLSSHEATQGFAKGSQACFLLLTQVTGVLRDAEGVCEVQTTRGRISTRLVINAAGPYAGVVGRMVGVELPLEPVRRQKAFIAADLPIPENSPMNIDTGRDVYWRPEPGGAYIGWVDPAEKVSEPAEEIPVDWDFPAIALHKLTCLFPFWLEITAKLKSSDIRISAGQYVYTPDDQPLIGQVPEVPGFYVNCGYWAGVMLSPMSGKCIADLITGNLDPLDNPLRPTRFQEGLITASASFLRGRH